MSNLLHNIEAKLKPLSLQHGDEVAQEDGEMLVAVPEGNHYGNLQTGMRWSDGLVNPR